MPCILTWYQWARLEVFFPICGGTSVGFFLSFFLGDEGGEKEERRDKPRRANLKRFMHISSTCSRDKAEGCLLVDKVNGLKARRVSRLSAVSPKPASEGSGSHAPMVGECICKRALLWEKCRREIKRLEKHIAAVVDSESSNACTAGEKKNCGAAVADPFQRCSLCSWGFPIEPSNWPKWNQPTN